MSDDFEFNEPPPCNPDELPEGEECPEKPPKDAEWGEEEKGGISPDMAFKLWGLVGLVNTILPTVLFMTRYNGTIGDAFFGSTW